MIDQATDERIGRLFVRNQTPWSSTDISRLFSEAADAVGLQIQEGLLLKVVEYGISNLKTGGWMKNLASCCIVLPVPTTPLGLIVAVADGLSADRRRELCQLAPAILTHGVLLGAPGVSVVDKLLHKCYVDRQFRTVVASNPKRKAVTWQPRSEWQTPLDHTRFTVRCDQPEMCHKLG